MSTPLGSMHIKLGLDSSQFASGLNASKRAVQYFSKEARALDGVIKNSGKSITTLSAKHKALKSALDKQKEVLGQLKANFDKLDATERGSSRWERAAAEIQKENAKLEQLSGQLKRVETDLTKVQQANSFWGKTGKSLTSFGNWLKNGGNRLQEMGNAMAPVSTLLSGGFTLATKKAMDFGGQMQVTKSLLSDTVGTSQELNAATKKLGDSSKAWAKEYGISTSEINVGMQELIKAGLDANQTVGAMPPILRATKATGEDFNTVMGATTSIMSQFGLVSNDTTQMLKNTQRVTDSLSFVANKTKAGFGDMGLAMEYVGPVANSVGMEVEETAAAVGLLSNAGIEGQKAGTALRGALSKLLNPSKANADAFEKLGFSAEEFRSGAIKLPDVLDRIKQNTEGMTDAQKAALIAQAFGVEAQSGMNTLVNEGGDALRRLTEETKNAGGYTEQLAKKMSGSAQSGMERFKASLEVLQINIGEKLIPHLSKFVDFLNDVVDGFGNLDSGTQNLILAFAGALAIGYPFLNILGNIASAGGSVFSVFGKLATKLSTIGKAKAAVDTLTGAKVAMEGAGAASTALSGGLSLATLGWGALALAGVAAVGTIAYFGQKALDARKRAEEWGTAVSETQAKDLSAFKDKVDESTRAMMAFGNGGREEVGAVRRAFSELRDEVNQLVDKNLAKDVKLAKKLGLSDEEIQYMKDKAGQTKNVVNKMSDEVINIYKNANSQRRVLSEEEKAIVLSAQNALIQEQLSQLKYSGKEKENITKAMNGQLEELNQTQLTKALAVTKQWIEEENKAYNKRKSQLERLFDEGKISRSTYNREMEELEAEHAARMEAFGEKYIAIRKKMAENAKFGGNAQAESAYWSTIEKEMTKLGLSYDQLQAKMRETANTASKSSSLVSTYWQGMSEEASSAVTYWNSIILDTKTGKVKTNAVEEIAKALQAEGGWEAMQLSLKEGRMTTTAKLAVGEALQANGQWEDLSPSEKALVTNNRPALEAIMESTTMLNQWNALPESVKKILGENDSFLNSADGAKRALDTWNLLQPYEKELLAKDLASDEAGKAQGAINRLTGKAVKLEADGDNVLTKVLESSTAINGLEQTNVPNLTAIDVTGPVVAGANASVNSAKQTAPIQLFAKDDTAGMVASAQASVNSPRQNAPVGLFAQNNTAGVVASTQAAVNSPRQNVPVGLFAQNNTAGPVGAANAAVNSPRQSSPTGIFALDNTWSGVSSARASVNSVQDKTVTITSIFRRVGEFFGFAKGTDNHPGGLSLVNDQKGSLYKELITLPSGLSFIPEGRNVMMDLPKGTKVLPARQTRDLMLAKKIPRYAQGVGYPADAPLFRSLEEAEQSLTKEVVLKSDNQDVVALLKSILAVLKAGGGLGDRIAVDVSGQLSYGLPDYRQLAERVGQLLAEELQRQSRLRGV